MWSTYEKQISLFCLDSKWFCKLTAIEYHYSNCNVLDVSSNFGCICFKGETNWQIVHGEESCSKIHYCRCQDNIANI